MALYGLARQWNRPVSEVNITPRQFAYHLAYDNLNPPMDERMEFMIAQMTAIFASVNSKKGTSIRPKDFMLSELMRDKTKPETNIDEKVRATFSLFKRSDSGDK